MYRPLFLVLTILAASDLSAQSNAADPNGRKDQIQAERLERAAHLNSEEPTAFHQQLANIVKAVQRTHIRIAVEGLGPGAGVYVGSVFERSDFKDRVVSRLWGAVSPHLFYRAGTGIEFNNGTAQGLVLSVSGWHSDAPQLVYYGPGPDSSINNQTDYRKEDTYVVFQAESRGHQLTPGCRAGILFVNVGPGTNPNLPATESVFGPAQAPGIDVQDNFWLGGCSLQYDRRDSSEYPLRGTYAAVGYVRYAPQQQEPFSFGRLSVAAEQYFPFLKDKRVITIRGKTEFSLHSADQEVPFYLQPTLGNDTELRGFRRYRFYDENSIALTAEYRWEVSTGFDAELFFDAGNVFHRPGELSLLQLEKSAGFGFRFTNRGAVIARLDTGFSREGVQFWLRFGKLY